MAKKNRAPRSAESLDTDRISLGSWLSIAIAVILLDQITKITALKTLQYGEFCPVTAFFNLVLVYNEGAAFNFLANAGGWQRWFLILLGISAGVFIVSILKHHNSQRIFSLSLVLILGGTLGNVIDRIVYGHVVDFLDFHLAEWHWPAFNVSDMCIVVGVILLILDEVCRAKRGK
ncbi:signal peptidase II [Candidatus Pandoraea novymonadis]|uniref:Lipoprotein signal peptidase n=1 Tax=Candidatus Pandoraea novymonadis TaxID=1808959 RepID=A0ABX5FEE5_9BURK|nr:signal peptidase II [Candidatus Pandoraea novymonadis]PSB91828.1 Lipoprotein signal peptidase [Candidatus Pandoraea novymonadis]